METNAFITTADYQKVVHKEEKSEAKPMGAFCKYAHYSDHCLTYPTAQQRREVLPPRSCFACLKTGHRNTECRYKRSCWFCKKKLATILYSVLRNLGNLINQIHRLQSHHKQEILLKDHLHRLPHLYRLLKKEKIHRLRKKNIL